MSAPANMGDIYSGVRLDFYTILVPGSSNVLIRHLTLKHGLILCLHCEVCDALVDLQFFLYTVRETEVQITETLQASGGKIRCNKMVMCQDNLVKKKIRCRYCM